MERPSGSGRAGIRIRDFTLPGRELRLASALESASLGGMAGVGTTGDTIGITTELFTTTTPISPTAEFSSIATTSIAADSMELAGFTEPADFMAEEREDSPVASMDLRRHTGSLALTLAHLAGLTMEESQEASPLAGIRALAEASTAVEVSTEAVAATEEAGTGNSV